MSETSKIHYECNAFNTIHVGDVGDTVLFLWRGRLWVWINWTTCTRTATWTVIHDLWITWLVLNNIFGRGWLNPKLSFIFLAGGWDGVAVLVEGCGTDVGGVKDSLAGGRERLGVENRVGVSFIRAEAATEAMVVSMDSSSMSSMSNESTGKHL